MEHTGVGSVGRFVIDSVPQRGWCRWVIGPFICIGIFRSDTITDMGALGAAVVVFVGVALGVTASHFRRRGESTSPPPSGNPDEGWELALRDSHPEAQACPMCKSEFPSGQLFCAKDGTALVDGAAETPVSVCPCCRRGFPEESQFCPHDAEELIPYAQFKAQRIQSSIPPRPMAKICPQCGQSYAQRQSFCAIDGSELLILN